MSKNQYDKEREELKLSLDLGEISHPEYLSTLKQIDLEEYADPITCVDCAYDLKDKKKKVKKNNKT